jgi:hypothetical protein
MARLRLIMQGYALHSLAANIELCKSIRTGEGININFVSDLND